MSTFRTSARTVDMLGRQQIAGVPSAISELFKNAHDAYAREAVANLLRQQRMLVVSDDGTGMTREEFESRWLTLGTSAKAIPGRQEPPRHGMRPRAVLGEKGIGRLAVAAIGRQTLILTRSAASPMTTAALLHWGAFEMHDADLSQIDIPLRECGPGELPDIRSMAAELQATLTRLASPHDRPLVNRIATDLSSIAEIDLSSLAQRIGRPAVPATHGTCFIITPTSDDLEADLDESADATQAPPLLKTLIGFANTMTPGHPEPELLTRFFDHKGDDDVVDLIEEAQFFTPDEFQSADHHFHGTFDAYGQFNGTVAIFGNEPRTYQVAWPAARGRRTRCGPFRLDLAYVQGRAVHSSLDPLDWRAITAKLDRYGGLYIYRDAIRVLPYGDNRFDWLDVELNRNKSASDHFFSYRRMFGAVALTREENAGLREKAGREGFATNEAYRQFRAILKNFLAQVALDYFRDTGVRAEEYREGRLANERLDRARRARSKSVRGRRDALRDDLNAFFDRVAEQAPQQAADQVNKQLNSSLRLALSQDPDEAARHIAEAEAQARRDIRGLSDSLQVSRPAGVGLTKELLRSYAEYEATRARIHQEVVEPLAQEVEHRIREADDDQLRALTRRLRFDSAIAEATGRSQDSLDRSRASLAERLTEVSTRSQGLVREARAVVAETLEAVRAEAARLDVATLEDSAFVAERTRFEHRAASTAAEHTRILDSVTEQLHQITWPTVEDDVVVTASDQIEQLEGRLEALLARAEQDAELTQLGMAVDIVNHEFQNTVKSIRANLRRLKGWADANPALQDVYRDMRASFDHLDGYLKLFTPLHRRLYRSAVDISGADINRFLIDLFGTRLDKQRVRLEATDAFRKAVVRAYPSTIYPAFVNLVDNAIHWLGTYSGDRIITLDADARGLTVTDSGPGIADADRDEVFELGFSRKQGGTGYGLYLAREALKTEDMELVLDPSRADRGAQFRIITAPAPGDEP